MRWVWCELRRWWQIRTGQAVDMPLHRLLCADCWSRVPAGEGHLDMCERCTDVVHAWFGEHAQRPGRVT